jgi:Skp family chaperone for outer membrane proteins
LGFDEKQQLAWKREEITVLREWIVSDVLDKAGKVAAQQGFDLVLAAVKVNAHAVDITDDVIAEVNK